MNRIACLFLSLPLVLGASLAAAETNSRVIARNHLAGLPTPKDVNVIDGREMGRRKIEVTYPWKNGNGLSKSFLSVREKNGRTKLLSNWTFTASKDSLKVTTSYPRKGFLGGQLVKDETQYSPIKGGFKAMTARTVRGHEVAFPQMRIILKGNQATFSHVEMSGRRSGAVLGRTFSHTATVPEHILGDGNVAAMTPYQKIGLTRYLDRTSSAAFNEFINRR